MHIKKTVMVFILLASLLTFGVYQTIQFHMIFRETKSGKVTSWRVLDINNTITDGGGDDVPGGGIPK